MAYVNFNKFALGKKNKLYDKNFMSIRETLRKKNKDKQAEKVITEW